MKIKEILSCHDYYYGLKIEVNGESCLSFQDGEPEDNDLSRNFNDVYSITDLVKKAYEAGKNGESLEYEYVNLEEEEEK